MKIVFYSAMWPDFEDDWGRVVSLGFGYLSACLRQQYPQVEIDVVRTEKELLASRANVVGLSCVTYMYKRAREAARRVKEARGATIVLGGPHVTALPERMDREFDYGVAFEGERTFVELVGRLLEGNSPEGLEEIDGLIFWRGEERVVNKPREPIQPLDSIPFPQRDWPSYQGYSSKDAPAISSRGCPYDCKFCATAKPWGAQRSHSVDYIVEEIGQIIEQRHPQTVRYEDDLFMADRKRLAKIAEAIRRRGYDKRVAFHVSARASMLTDEACAILASFNTRSVFVGFESDSRMVLESLGKTGQTPEKNQAAVDNVRRHGMSLFGSFILGAPGETIDDAYETHNFIDRNLDAFTYFHTGVLRLLPGTEFFRQGLEKGLIDEQLTGIVLEEDEIDGWLSLSERHPMLSETMSRGELKAMNLAFFDLARFHDERMRAKGLEGERDQARGSSIDALGIRAVSGALARKVTQKLRGG
jgi:anaerobic magnesium-protoporphyrin IX monomethyl ester cyclase